MRAPRCEIAARQQPSRTWLLDVVTPLGLLCLCPCLVGATIIGAASMALAGNCLGSFTRDLAMSRGLSANAGQLITGPTGSSFANVLVAVSFARLGNYGSPRRRDSCGVAHIGGSAEEAILNMGRAAIAGLESATVPQRGTKYWPA